MHEDQKLLSMFKRPPGDGGLTQRKHGIFFLGLGTDAFNHSGQPLGVDTNVLGLPRTLLAVSMEE